MQVSCDMKDGLQVWVHRVPNLDEVNVVVWEIKPQTTCRTRAITIGDITITLFGEELCQPQSAE
jgi:hypothetical protein